MIDITMLSRIYFIRRLNESFVDDIYELCKGNPQFYQYSEAPLRKEQVLADLYLTPPGIGLEDKYFLGFYKNDVLVAVMDLVDGYPEKDICFIGFFMMNRNFQGKHSGSAIIHEVCDALQKRGKDAVRLCIDKGNPQSTHFWTKNGFTILKEIDRKGHPVLLAEKKL